MGYHRAGFDVIGVDIEPQPNYPFEFIQANALTFINRLVAGGTWDFKGLGLFDAIHASPPCQHYSDLAHRNGNADEHPDLIPQVRELLEATGLPHVIENVEGAPLRDPIRLCGVNFPSLRVIRHRLFETNFPVPEFFHHKHPLCYTRDKRKAHYGKRDEMVDYVSVNGGGNCSVAAARDAMGIDWMTKAELNEAIPPAYTTWIGFHLMRHIHSGCEEREASEYAA